MDFLGPGRVGRWFGKPNFGNGRQEKFLFKEGPLSKITGGKKRPLGERVATKVKDITDEKPKETHRPQRMDGRGIRPTAMRAGVGGDNRGLDQGTGEHNTVGLNQFLLRKVGISGKGGFNGCRH